MTYVHPNYSWNEKLYHKGCRVERESKRSAHDLKRAKKNYMFNYFYKIKVRSKVKEFISFFLEILPNMYNDQMHFILLILVSSKSTWLWQLFHFILLIQIRSKSTCMWEHNNHVHRKTRKNREEKKTTSQCQICTLYTTLQNENGSARNENFPAVFEFPEILSYMHLFDFMLPQYYLLQQVIQRRSEIIT